MGFSAGFNVIKKVPGCTFEEMIEARKRADFENDHWLKSHYKSYEEFRKSNYDKSLKIDVSDRLVQFYKDTKPIEICDWCSNARYFHDDITTLLESDFPDYFEVDNEALERLFKYTEEKAKDLELIPVNITHGIKLLKNDEDEAESKLIPIDGVQIELEDGSIRQLYTEYDYGILLVSKSFADIEQIYTFQSLFKCIYELKQYSMTEYFVYYWCG